MIHRFTLTVEYYMEVDVDADSREDAVRQIREECKAIPIPEHGQWFGGDLRAFDDEGNLAAGDPWYPPVAEPVSRLEETR